MQVFEQAANETVLGKPPDANSLCYLILRGSILCLRVACSSSGTHAPLVMIFCRAVIERREHPGPVESAFLVSSPRDLVHPDFHLLVSLHPLPLLRQALALLRLPTDGSQALCLP